MRQRQATITLHDWPAHSTSPPRTAPGCMQALRAGPRPRPRHTAWRSRALNVVPMVVRETYSHLLLPTVVLPVVPPVRAFATRRWTQPGPSSRRRSKRRKSSFLSPARRYRLDPFNSRSITAATIAVIASHARRRLTLWPWAIHLVVWKCLSLHRLAVTTKCTSGADIMTACQARQSMSVCIYTRWCIFITSIVADRSISPEYARNNCSSRRVERHQDELHLAVCPRRRSRRPSLRTLSPFAMLRRRP